MTMAQTERPGAGWVPADDTFGVRLAMIRQRMQWGNVKEAALACGLPPESWRTWERDGVAPRRLVEIAALISERTGVDFDWLLRGRERPPMDVLHYRRGSQRRSTGGYTSRPADDRPAPRSRPGTPRRTVQSAA